LVGSDSKEEVITAFHPARQHGLNQRVSWIDEDMIGPESVKVECKLNHFKLRCSEQRVAEIESARGDVGGVRLIGTKRQESELPSTLFEQAEYETRSGGSDKIANQLAIHDQSGQ
jgi:hypothetical protein